MPQSRVWTAPSVNSVRVAKEEHSEPSMRTPEPSLQQAVKPAMTTTVIAPPAPPAPEAPPPVVAISQTPAVLLASRPTESFLLKPAADVRPVTAPLENVSAQPVSNLLLRDDSQPTPAPQPATDTQMPPSPAGAPAPLSPAAAPASSTQKLGEEPKSYNLEFLRQQSVLLKPCEWQIDVGISYLYDTRPYPTLTPVIHELLDENIRRRLLTMPLEIRYGLFENVQLFANAPVGWSNTEVSYAGSQEYSDEYYNDGGIGDTNAGASILIHKSCGTSFSPDVVATFGITAPTGPGNALSGLFSVPQSTLGQGYWAGNWNILFIHQYDPIILFYGFGGRHFLTRQIDVLGVGVDAKPGDQYLYQMGVGFALNERITLSTTFMGYYITEAYLADHRVPGTIMEPMYVRCAATIMRPNKHIVEPFVEFGITDDAPDARVGMTWTF
jgi:hypothetical protein